MQGGQAHEVGDAKQFLRWLSSLCDEVFDRAPRFHNELLNRSDPSSAANSALYKLVKAMVGSSDTERFGISSMPPEVSMYESLLRRGGFHHSDEMQQHWWIGEPDENWKPVWQEVESFLESTHSGRRPLVDLYQCLSQPPFGMRRGPMPVLAIAMLHSRRTTVGLYQGGLFQPSLTAQLAEQMARNPEDFEVQEFVFDEETRDLLQAMTTVVRSLEGGTDDSEESPLLGVARPLILLAARLPRYARTTKFLSPSHAVRLRDVLMKARDPHELLLRDIPSLLGVSSPDAQASKLLATRLEEALQGIQRAYPDLLDAIERQVREAFDLGADGSRDIRDELARRTKPLIGLVADPTLSAFVQRAANPREQDDWREVIGLVVVQGRAPRDWTDPDRAVFQTNIQQLAGEFRRLEELAYEKRRVGSGKAIRIGVLGDQGEEARELIRIPSEDEEQVEVLADSVREVLVGYGGIELSGTGRGVKLAALVRLLVEHLGEQEGES